MRRKKIKDYQVRDKFFYAVPSLFPLWPYPSRLAIGVNLADFRARNAPFFNFKVKDKIYSIPREKALEVGTKYLMPGGFSLPNLLPKEEFSIVEEGLKEPPQYDIDPVTNMAYLRGSRNPRTQTAKQQTLL